MSVGNSMTNSVVWKIYVIVIILYFNEAILYLFPRYTNVDSPWVPHAGFRSWLARRYARVIHLAKSVKRLDTFIALITCDHIIFGRAQKGNRKRAKGKVLPGIEPGLPEGRSNQNPKC